MLCDKQRSMLVRPNHHYPIICQYYWCDVEVINQADFGVTRSPYQHHHGMCQNIRSMWTDYHYYGIFHNSIWGKHKKKWPAEFGVTKKSSLSCICKNSMVCQTLEQVTHLSWRDQITTIVIFSRTIRQKQGQVTSWVWCGQIITSYQIICYKSWSKRWTKNCATRSSLSHYLSWQCCETNKGTRDKLSLVWPDNHYPVICYSSIVWPYQHNHDMRDNSITLQTIIEVTYSGWCDLIITIILSFSTIFCDKYRNKWPADLVRSSWSYNLSKEYGKPSIQASH